jgi:hypothetical protein
MSVTVKKPGLDQAMTRVELAKTCRKKMGFEPNRSRKLYSGVAHKLEL